MQSRWVCGTVGLSAESFGQGEMQILTDSPSGCQENEGGRCSTSSREDSKKFSAMNTYGS